MENNKPLDLIDRQALGIGRCNPDAFPLQNRGYCAGWNGVVNLLEQAPRVDAVQVVHGVWKYKQTNSLFLWHLECSVCGQDYHTQVGYNYCPNCGAKMDGVKE
jgi:hypothetical protein